MNQSFLQHKKSNKRATAKVSLLLLVAFVVKSFHFQIIPEVIVSENISPRCSTPCSRLNTYLRHKKSKLKTASVVNVPRFSSKFSLRATLSISVL